MNQGGVIITTLKQDGTKIVTQSKSKNEKCIDDILIINQNKEQSKDEIHQHSDIVDNQMQFEHKQEPSEADNVIIRAEIEDNEQPIDQTKSIKKKKTLAKKKNAKSSKAIAPPRLSETKIIVD